MARRCTSTQTGAVSLLQLCLVSLLVLPARALYFYLDNHPKCFFEELPKDTLVVGHYDAECYDANTRTYRANDALQIAITVDEVFDSDHRIVNQRGSSKGALTFTAADSGDHRICFAPQNVPQRHGYLANGQQTGGVRFYLDLAIGETSLIESADKGKIMDIVQRVKDLNGRLQDIRREQVFQREREAEFRDQSESTNARVVKWTLIQLVILGLTCTWQLSHLRAFFIKQKLT